MRWQRIMLQWSFFVLCVAVLLMTSMIVLYCRSPSPSPVSIVISSSPLSYKHGLHPSCCTCVATKTQNSLPGHEAQSVTCLATDASLTAD